MIARQGKFAILALALAFATIASGAEAGSRSVGVGIGIGTGLQILNQLSKGGSGSTRKRSYSKKNGTGNSVKSAKKGKTQPRKDDDEAKTVTSKADEGGEASSKSNEKEAGVAPNSQPAGSATLATVPTTTAALPAAAGNVISTKEEITSAQEHLRYLGYEVPVTSDKLDLDTKIAVMKFQDSIGAQATGALTIEQLQRLFVMADEKQKQAK
jgi:hypothetical protein